MQITYPGPPATDTAGAAVTSGVTGAIVSVTDRDGTAISSPGAAFHIAGGNPSVAYDAAAKGEAWVTYSLTASGHTFANVSVFCSADPQTLAALPSAILGASVDGSLTLQQIMALQQSVNSGHYSVGALNTGTHQKVFTYYRADGTTVLAVSTVTYDTANANPVSRSVVFSNLP